MEMDDRAAVRAAMYQSEPDPAEAGSSSPTVASHTRTRKIRVGIIEYEVPTVEYVQHLEQTVLRQGRMIEQSQRLIDRLVAGVARLRHTQSSHGGAMDELKTELGKKITQRDFS